MLEVVQRQLAAAKNELERLRQEHDTSERSGRVFKLRCTRAEEELGHEKERAAQRAEEQQSEIDSLREQLRAG